MKRITLILVLLSFALLTGCLKTRTQVKSGQNVETQDPSLADAPSRGSKYELEEIRNEVTRLSGKIEEAEHRQKGQDSTITTDFKEILMKLENRVSELEKNQILVLSELKNLKDRGTTVLHTPTPAKTHSQSPKDLIAEGNELIKNHKFEEASQKFQAVLDQGVRGKMAAETYFGLGESEFGNKNYKKAIVHYSKVQETYSKSLLIPSSLYRIAQSFQHLNMFKEAKGFFAELIEKYPKSGEAIKAQKKIKD